MKLEWGSGSDLHFCTVDQCRSWAELGVDDLHTKERHPHHSLLPSLPHPSPPPHIHPHLPSWSLSHLKQTRLQHLFTSTASITASQRKHLHLPPVALDAYLCIRIHHDHRVASSCPHQHLSSSSSQVSHALDASFLQSMHRLSLPPLRLLIKNVSTVVL